MKQVLHNLKSGATKVTNVPCPATQEGHLLVRSSASLISTGTERMLVSFGRASLIDKARQQPERVKQALDKVKADGLLTTLEAVNNKLDQPLALGYCNVGTVLGVGVGVAGFGQGDRVASNGRHAEVVSVPANLCAKIPDQVSDAAAAFTALGAIALQGIRLAQPTLGETVVVTGLGLIGLLTVQLLRAHGCRVLGIDLDLDRAKIARSFGVEVIQLAAGADPVEAAITYSRGRGVDAVIVTASTKSNEPVDQAARMCRKRGRIVLVGIAGLDLKRSNFYEKELTLQVSCSYGPGRYDPAYEEKGQDYPIGFVRWTEQRNFEAILDMMADGRLDVASLISHRFPIEQAESAYAVLAGAEPSLGILLEYPTTDTRTDRVLLKRTIQLSPPSPSRNGDVAVSFIGSGNYATRVLMPAFEAAGARLRSAASSGGLGSVHAGRKHGFEEATTDAKCILDDPEIDAVAITTRHASHAGFVIAALEAGKHVFVEKPLCLTLEDLSAIEAAYRAMAEARILMVGFNRRFAPHTLRIKKLLAPMRVPKSFIMTVNAGAIPEEHWSQDPEIGGGRLVGEGCHFVDLLRYLVGAPITEFSCNPLASSTGDTASIQLLFEEGSIGTVHYFANGSRRFPKERLEVFCGGRILQLDNFRKARGFGWSGFSRLNLWRQDKGQGACAAAFVDAIRKGGKAPIPFDEICEVARVTISLAKG